MGSGISKKPPSYNNILKKDPIISKILNHKVSLDSITVVLDNLTWPELITLKNKILHFISLHNSLNVKSFHRLTKTLEKIKSYLISKRKLHLQQERRKHLNALRESRIRREQVQSNV